jgi:hypothetical protein
MKDKTNDRGSRCESTAFIAVCAAAPGGGMEVEMKKIVYGIKPPCPKCPYTLGHVQFVTNPCPECKANNYRMYEELVKGKGGQLFSE